MEAIHLSIHSKTTVLCVCISCLFFLGLQIWRSTNGPPTSSKITKQPRKKNTKSVLHFELTLNCWNTNNLDHYGEGSNTDAYRVFMFRSSVFSLTLQASLSSVSFFFRNFFCCSSKGIKFLLVRIFYTIRLFFCLAPTLSLPPLSLSLTLT